MAEEFKPLERFLDDALILPVPCRDGVTRKFRIAAPSAEDGLRVELLTTAAARLLTSGKPADSEMVDDEDERHIFRLVLGDVHDDILRQVDWALFRHVAFTAMTWIVNDRAGAETYWNSAGLPPRQAPNRAARRSQGTGSSGSAAASTTRSRGSTSGTRADSPRSGQGKRRRR